MNIDINFEKYHFKHLSYNDLKWLNVLFADKETQKRMGGMLPLDVFYSSTKELPNYYNIVAWEDDKPTAFLTVEINNNDVASIAIVVNPTRRRQGVGHTILTNICNLLEDKQAYAEIEADNIASIALFESCGFINDGITEEGFLRYFRPRRTNTVN
ncbi:hypothetical protein FACS1894219_06490 [Clostridia bacterium]|nr:hypothetical protein FACS1894219_06490 [Clostridia bacterium]